MERFTVTRVSNKDVGRFRNEIAVNVNELKNMRKNSRTVPNPGDARKFSLAQLTRFEKFLSINYLIDNSLISRE